MLLPRTAPPSAAGTEVVVLDDAARLHDVVPLWEDLARHALEPNVFYEPWMLLPALRAFGAGEDLSFVLVLERDAAAPAGPARLLGLFPLERRRHYRRRHHRLHRFHLRLRREQRRSSGRPAGREGVGRRGGIFVETRLGSLARK